MSLFSIEPMESRTMLSGIGQATLVRNVPLRGPWDAPSSELVAAGDRLFLNPDSPDGGTELWKSDGTRRGTVRVMRFGHFADHVFVRDLVAVNKDVYFDVGSAVWRSDGTLRGTRPVAQPRQGVAMLGGIQGNFFFQVGNEL